MPVKLMLLGCLQLAACQLVSPPRDPQPQALAAGSGAVSQEPGSDSLKPQPLPPLEAE